MNWCWYCRRGLHLICPRYVRGWVGRCECICPKQAGHDDD